MNSEESEWVPPTALGLQNNQFRANLLNGIIGWNKILITATLIERLDIADINENDIISKIAAFKDEDFKYRFDPYGERDMIVLDDGLITIWAKIDYYNEDMTQGSEDPTNVKITRRVLIIMLPSDY